MTMAKKGARQLLKADGVTFVLRDEDRCFYADEDAISPLWKGERFPMSKCVSGWSMRHRESVVIEDIYLDDRVPHAAYRATFVRSLVMVPINDDHPVGAIGAYWALLRRPSQKYVENLQRIASAAAVAMMNFSYIPKTMQKS
jgi:GAF domain-containing protein